MMDLKMEFHPQQAAMYGDVSSSHSGSFSSASAAGPVGSSYDAYTPVSMSGRSTPVGSQRLGSVDYSSNASFTDMPLEMTPPSSATMPFFSMNMPPSTTPAPMSGMSGGYLSSSVFPQPPATPERNGSFSSHGTAGTPGSPGVMIPSYPASVASMSSMTSMTTLGSSVSPHHDSAMCGPATPGAYPFSESSIPATKAALSGQYPLPAPFQTRGYPTPQSAHSLGHDGSDFSPSEFCWANRPESPAINYFGERPSLPPPPPSATLKSSVVKSEGPGADAYLSPTSESPYGTSPSRRSLHYMGARSSARALQGAVDSNDNHDYGSHMQAEPVDGTIVTRNGIQVSRVASGAYKCIVPGCPSRPFKRSEHLKRHVTTYVPPMSFFLTSPPNSASVANTTFLV